MTTLDPTPLAGRAGVRDLEARMAARMRADGIEPATSVFEDSREVRVGPVIAQWREGREKRLAVTLLLELESGDRATLALDTLDPESASARAKLVAQTPPERRSDASRALLDLALEVAAARAMRQHGEAAEAAAGEEPWPVAVDGDLLIKDIDAYIGGYIALCEEARLAIALWVIHTHAFAAADHTPYLRISSATRECGKTNLLEVITEVVCRPWFTAGVSGAVLYRKIALETPTLLLDEIDTQSANEETAEIVRGVLNAGFKRGGQIDRMVGEGAAMKPGSFAVFCPKCIAGIRQPPDTVLSRSIPIRLQHEPRAVTDQLKKPRARRLKAEAAPLRRRISRFAKDALESLKDAEPEVPPQLGARQADVWSPLLAIADHIGGVWPAYARLAAVVLHGAERTEGDRGILMLTDLRAVFQDAGDPAHLPTTRIIEELVKREDRPWAEYGRGKAITPGGVAKLMARFDLVPTNGRHGGSVLKGYEYEGLAVWWTKYRIDAIRSPAGSGAPATRQVVDVPTLDLECSGVADFPREGEGKKRNQGGSPP